MGGNLNHILKVLQMGEHHLARQLLAQYIKENPTNGEAWYALSFLVDSWEQKVDCLKRASRLMPNSQKVKSRLEWVILSPQAENQSQKEVSSSTRVQEGINCQLSVTNNTTASRVSPPSTYSRNLWQIGIGESDQPEQPDVIQLLFDDIAQLPIITNPNQELWLGVHLQAAKQLHEIHRKWQARTDGITFSEVIWETIFDNWYVLEQNCIAEDIPVPKLNSWSSELVAARRNVYGLHSSRLRRFIRRLQTLSESEVSTQLLTTTYKVVETLAILSGEALVKLTRFIEQHDHLPEPSRLRNWLSDDFNFAKQEVQRRTKQAVHTLTNGYLRYALRVAQGYVGQGLDYADLVQAGFIGLMKAAERFDYRVQARFGSYATSWIWQGIGREIAEQGRTVRVPVHVQEALRKWDVACKQFDDGYNDPTTNPKILANAGLLEPHTYSHIQKCRQKRVPMPTRTVEEYKQAIAKAKKLSDYSIQVVSLSQVVATSQERYSRFWELEDVLPDGGLLPDRVLDLAAIGEVVKGQLFPVLSQREREVLELRYGLTDGEERTLEQVGEIFGLTRERIRQIEAKAFKTLNGRISVGKLPNLRNLLIEERTNSPLPSGTRFITNDQTEYTDKTGWDKLDDMLHRLPRSNWVEGRTGLQSGERREQLIAALTALGGPAHLTDIAEQINDAIEDKELEDSHVYNLLLRDESAFILLGQGIFSLVAWEQVRAKEAEPVLLCCPMILPDPPEYENAFFESVLVGQQELAREPTAGQFSRTMLNWAKAEPNQQNWFFQSILSAYYLVDLIPYVFYFGGEDPVLHSVLPDDMSIQDLRYHCLHKLTERLVGMAEFWWLFQQRQPTRPTDLGETFADIHPNGLDDALPRLRLLASLGAAQKLKYGAYRLTALGEECANLWKTEPVFETAVILEDDPVHDFAGLAIW